MTPSDILRASQDNALGPSAEALQLSEKAQTPQDHEGAMYGHRRAMEHLYKKASPDEPKHATRTRMIMLDFHAQMVNHHFAHRL